MLHSVNTPDLGTDEAEVIELLVKVGQTIDVDTPLVLVESAKASMEVPSPVAGVVKEILVTLGAKISEGVLLLQVETATDTSPVAETEPVTSTASPEPTKEVISEPIPASSPPQTNNPVEKVY